MMVFGLQLLLKPKFSGIEKIKTIGSTYMTASGLRPGKEEGAMVSLLLSYLSLLSVHSTNHPSLSILLNLKIKNDAVSNTLEFCLF